MGFIYLWQFQQMAMEKPIISRLSWPIGIFHEQPDNQNQSEFPKHILLEPTVMAQLTVINEMK